MPVPTAVIGEAFGLTVALTVLVAGCAIDGTWWSLLTATCYIVALGIWAMFRPGCMPCVPTQTGLGVENAGCCGAPPSPLRAPRRAPCSRRFGALCEPAEASGRVARQAASCGATGARGSPPSSRRGRSASRL